MNRVQLIDLIRKRKSFLCVGLDTDIEKIPKFLLKEEDPIFEFNRQIIDATRHLCIAYKPNTAFYEALGSKGWESLQKTAEYIGKEHLVIADAKRGDIGNTSDMYARAFFENMNFDAITVSPYMGKDSIEPYLKYPGKWAIVLALTSNPGALDFQFQRLQTADIHVFEKVLKRSSMWGTPNNLMYVVGATRGDLISVVRKWIPDHFLLVPGLGAQGGSLHEVVTNGRNNDVGLIVNASRSIIYGSRGADFAIKAAEEAGRIQKEMASYM